MNIGVLPVKPTPFLNVFSELAITIVFLKLGLDEEASHFILGIKKAWGIALFGALSPFAAAFGIGYFY